MKIVFAEPLGACACTIEELTQTLKKQGHEIIFYPDRTEEETALIERGKEADIFVLSNIPLRENFFDQCPNIKMLSVAFTGVDHIDLEACKKRNITISNAAGYSTQAVAELTIGMIIAVYRRIVGGDTITRICGDRQTFLGMELNGKTIGIIGAGAIGQKVATLAHAFGCKILIHSRTTKKIPHATFVDKATLLAQSDIITLHLPLNQQTHHFIGTEEITLMQPHAILINTARGPIISQEALYHALRKGIIAGAAVDVYDQEPPLPAHSELFNAPNLLMLPHMGYATKEAFAIRLNIVIKNIQKWLTGTPQNLIR